MRSRFWCVGAVAVLFVSTIASGEILSYTTQYKVEDPEGVVYNDPEVASITCNANTSTPFQGGYAEGRHYMYTTESANNLNWSYELYVWAEGELTIHDLDYGTFESYAHASGYCKYVSDVPEELTAYVDQSLQGQYQHYFFHDDWYDGTYYIYKEGGSYYSFEANDGIDCRHAAFASACVTEGTSSAFSHICARAIPGLWVY
jgi:hypothetical protein